LLGQRIFWFCKDIEKIRLCQGVQFYSDGKPPLKFRNKIRRLGYVKGPGPDKQDMIRLNHAVLGRDITAFYDRQHITLYALAADIGSASSFTVAGRFSYFIDFINKHNAVLLDAVEGFLDCSIVI